MKKIVALLLSVLMILSMAAVAEEALDPALVTRVSNLVIESTADGETSALNLEGLEAYISIDTTDGLSLVAQAFNGDDSLLLAVAKLVDTQIQLAIDGVDKTFAQDVAQLQGQDTAALGELLRPALPQLMNVKLPPIALGSLSKIDLVPVVGMLGAETEGDTTTFAVPSEIIDTLLDQLLDALKSTGSSIPGLDQVLPMLEQLRAAGMSLALSGQIVDAADQQTTRLEIYPVTNGETAEAAVAVLTLTSAQDALSLQVDIPSDEDVMTVATLNVETAADNSAIATLDIAGMMQFSLAVYQDNGLQYVALTMDSGFEASFAVTLCYGENGAEDIFEVTFATGDDAGFDLIVNTTATEEGTQGSFELTTSGEDSGLHVTADFEEFLGSIDLGDFTMPTEIVGMEELESEENAEALQTALMPLIQYISQVLTDAAA